MKRLLILLSLFVLSLPSLQAQELVEEPQLKTRHELGFNMVALVRNIINLGDHPIEQGFSVLSQKCIDTHLLVSPSRADQQKLAYFPLLTLVQNICLLAHP